MLNEEAKKHGYPSISHLIKAIHHGTVSRSMAMSRLAFMVGCNPDYGMDCKCTCKRPLKKHIIG